MQVLIYDPRSFELLNLYYNDRSKQTSSARQEALYRLSSEGHIDDNLYRFEYVCVFYSCFYLFSLCQRMSWLFNWLARKIK